MKISGQLVDIFARDIFPANIYFSDGKIEKIEKIDSAPEVYIMPGLIDAHIHIESSMVTPGAFSLTAVRHGTIGVVSDPHEIANVLGVDGIRYMINDAGKVPMKFWFGASSCVPATSFETNGAAVNSDDIDFLLASNEIKYLAEMMNFPGVIYGDPEVGAKLGLAKKYSKPVDGHAPGLSGEMLRSYVAAGISTDHECSTAGEAREKLALGMKILIREGSAARNLDALKDLFNTDPESIMLCSDDLHPEMLLKGHINKLIARLISQGYDKFDVIRCATLNPVNHYNLEAGLLREGDPADFILADNLKSMNIIQTWIDGNQVFDKENVKFRYEPGQAVNKFNCSPISASQIKVKNEHRNIRIIEATGGELLTKEVHAVPGNGEFVMPEIAKDILKIVVKDRYKDKPPVVGFIKGFGLQQGAMASSVAHDSHNIIAVGSSDEQICTVVNEIIRIKGGLAVTNKDKVHSLQLDIAGIMTTSSCKTVAREYELLNEKAKSLGCKLDAPFMTLAFMALLVIPELKIGDRGLFNVNDFRIVPLFVD